MKLSLVFAAVSVSLMSSAIHAETDDDLYMVYMNPFFVQKHEQDAIDGGYSRPRVPDVIKHSERADYVARNFEKFRHSPGVERGKNEIARGFGLKKVVREAMHSPAFYAHLNEKEVQALRKSDRVVSVDKIDDQPGSIVLSSYYDSYLGLEVQPWGRKRVGVNDLITPSINFYILDAPYVSPALSSELNVVSTNSTVAAIDSYHPASVLSIAAGRANSTGIRGINPGQKIVHRQLGAGKSAVADDINVLAAQAEWAGQFATLNLSFNVKGTASISDNPFHHQDVLGRAIRRASGRLFVAQSAGNWSKDACLAAFTYGGQPAQQNDGIMVVGGIDRFGDRFMPGDNPPPSAMEGRSNHGHCVDIYAPGHQMTTTWQNGSVVTATGTSYSAPIVAAIAGRYGDASTRPIEREAYIRNGSAWTGKYDGAAGHPIREVKYTAPSSHSIPKRLPVSAVYSNTNTANLNKLVDQLFYDGINWSAGAGWGSVVLDLGLAKNVKGIRVMMRSSAANGGQLNFAVHGGNSINILGPGRALIPVNPIAYLNTTDQFDLVPYYIPINGNYRYVMLEGNNSTSWLSYSEVEVYGF